MRPIPANGKLRRVYNMNVKTGDICYFLDVRQPDKREFIKIRVKVLDKTIHFAAVDTKINLKEVIGDDHSVLDYPWYLFSQMEMLWFKKIVSALGANYEALVNNQDGTDGIVFIGFCSLAEEDSKNKPGGKPVFDTRLFLKAVDEFKI